jgi:hypothetical protein
VSRVIWNTEAIGTPLISSEPQLSSFKRSEADGECGNRDEGVYEMAQWAIQLPRTDRLLLEGDHGWDLTVV